MYVFLMICTMLIINKCIEFIKKVILFFIRYGWEGRWKSAIESREGWKAPKGRRGKICEFWILNWYFFKFLSGLKEWSQIFYFIYFYFVMTEFWLIMWNENKEILADGVTVKHKILADGMRAKQNCGWCVKIKQRILYDSVRVKQEFGLMV